MDFSICQVPVSILAELSVCQQARGDASSISNADCCESLRLYRSPVTGGPSPLSL